MTFDEASIAAPAAPRKKGIPAWVWVLLTLFVGGPILLAVIAIVAAIAIPSLMSARFEVNQAKVQTDLRAITAAIESYAAIHGEYPPNLGVLAHPDDHGAAYLNSTEVPADPWGVPYRYALPQDGLPYPRVFTLGMDGHPGGEFLDEDFDNLAMY